MDNHCPARILSQRRWNGFKGFFSSLMPKDSSPDKSPFTVTCVLISTSLELTFAQDCTLETACSDCTKESSVSVYPCSRKGNFNLSYNLSLLPVWLIWKEPQCKEKFVIHTITSDKSYSQTLLTNFINKVVNLPNTCTLKKMLVILDLKSGASKKMHTMVISSPPTIYLKKSSNSNPNKIMMSECDQHVDEDCFDRTADEQNI